MTSFRAPPIELHRVPAGTCCWCGDPILPGQRRKPERASWHDHCIGEIKVIKESGPRRAALFRRDSGVCALCGEVCWSCEVRPVVTYHDWSWHGTLRHISGQTVDGPYSVVEFKQTHAWEADHVVPLHLVDRSLPWAEIKRFWTLDNLQTLCPDCHHGKSAREAGHRARVRRPQMALALEAA